MELWPEGFNLFIISGRMDSVRKQNHEHIFLQIHPYGRTRKTQMSHTIGGEVLPGTYTLVVTTSINGALQEKEVILSVQN